MKTELISLAAGALLSAVTLTLAHATPAGDQWLAETRVALEARLTGDAVPDAGRVVTVRLTATDEPRASDPQIVGSSGSLDYDAAARKALAGLKLTPPPIELRSRQVTFTLGRTTTAGASADGAR